VKLATADSWDTGIRGRNQALSIPVSRYPGSPKHLGVPGCWDAPAHGRAEPHGGPWPPGSSQSTTNAAHQPHSSPDVALRTTPRPRGSVVLLPGRMRDFFRPLGCAASSWDTGTQGYWDPSIPAPRYTGTPGYWEIESRDSPSVWCAKGLRTPEAQPSSWDTGTPVSRNTGSLDSRDTGTVGAPKAFVGALTRCPACTSPLAAASRSVHAGSQEPPYTRCSGGVG